MDRLVWVVLLAGMLLAPSSAVSSSGREEFQDFDQVRIEDLLDQVVVTASRFEQTVRESPTATTVIRSEDIRFSAARTIPDLLRMVPGLNVMSPTQSDQNVSARSPSAPGANKMLVLIDGRYAYDDIYGMVAWGTFPISLEEIERIEVIQGPGSALYGANAFSGVINIITKTPAELSGTRMIVHLGEHEACHSDLIHGVQGERIGYKLSAGWNQSKSRDRDPDGFERLSKFGTEARYTLAPDCSIGFSGGVSNSQYALLAPLINETYRLDGPTSHASLDYRSPGLLVRTFWTAQAVTTLSSGSSVLRINSYNGEIQKTVMQSRGHRLVGGGSTRLLTVDWYMLGGDHQQFLWSGFLYDEFRASNRLILSLGGRYDHHPLVGGHLSPRGSLVFLPGESHTLRFSAGTAYRNPSQLESYINFHEDVGMGLVLWSHGNQDLRSEQATSLDCGYQALITRDLAASVALFHNRLSRTIDLDVVRFFDVPPSPIHGIPEELSLTNARSVSIWGGEGSLDATPVPWMKAGVFYGFERATDRATQAVIRTSPLHRLGGMIRTFPRHGLSLEGRAVWLGKTEWTSVRFVGPPKVEVIPAHAFLEARFACSMLRDRVELFVAGQDLLRSAGREHPDGMEVGRTVYGGVKVSLAASAADSRAPQHGTDPAKP